MPAVGNVGGEARVGEGAEADEHREILARHAHKFNGTL